MIDMSPHESAVCDIWDMVEAKYPEAAHCNFTDYALDLFAQAIAAEEKELSATKKALDLALAVWFPNEPPDSRAVSPQFVACAAVSTGDISPEVMQVIDEATASFTDGDQER